MHADCLSGVQGGFECVFSLAIAAEEDDGTQLVARSPSRRAGSSGLMKHAVSKASAASAREHGPKSPRKERHSFPGGIGSVAMGICGDLRVAEEGQILRNGRKQDMAKPGTKVIRPGNSAGRLAGIWRGRCQLERFSSDEWYF